jgi:hypothetical protein
VEKTESEVAEAAFVNAFILGNKRERWLSCLASEKKRNKVLIRLAHVFETDLDPRFVYEKANPPLEIQEEVQLLLAQWRKKNPTELFHLIVYGHDKDGTTMPLVEAESDFDLTFGVVIIIIPNKLAYYHPEQDNLSRQPFKLLFRRT